MKLKLLEPLVEISSQIDVAALALKEGKRCYQTGSCPLPEFIFRGLVLIIFFSSVFFWLLVLP